MKNFMPGMSLDIGSFELVRALLPYLVVAFLRKNNIFPCHDRQRPTNIESPPYPQKKLFTVASHLQRSFDRSISTLDEAIPEDGP